MDKTIRPVVIAASTLLVASVVTLGVKAGGTDDADAVNGDGAVAAGTESATDDTTTAAPDTSTDNTTTAPDASTDDTTTAPDASTDDTTTSAPDTSSDDTTDGATSTDDATTDAGDSAAGQATDDLDEMPETGGGLAIALGGIIAGGSALGLRRRR